MTSIGLQQLAGRLAVFIIVPLYFLFLRLRGYKLREVKRIRSEWKNHLREHRGPWIICANHLTMIDSLLLMSGLLSLSDHLFRYEQVPWNLPERANFQRSLALSVICYLSKCIPVNRGGDREEMKVVMGVCNALLKKRQILLIFPEGGRSRTGRVNTEGYSYGVGRFIAEHPDCRVLCVYLRGKHQKTYSNIPRKGEVFGMTLSALAPERTEAQGLRAQRHYARQIVQQLAGMEEAYFATGR